MTLRIFILSILILSQVKAGTVSNTCKKDSDCVLLSVCNVILASSKAVAETNDQYSLQGGIYHSKVYKDCDPNYTNIIAPDHRNLASKCVKNICVLKKKK